MAYTTINKPSQYFNTKLYTGNGNTTQSITGVGFQPDFSWVKNRSSGVAFHRLVDVIRGATKTLYSNSTIAESTEDSNGYIASFDSDGLTVNLGSSGTGTGTNSSGDNFVTWNWLANGAGVSNTSGTITSTVSANTTAGISIVGYTGTGANATVGHGLGVAPKMIIFKSRNSATSWPVYHESLGATNFVALSNTDASSASSLPFNNTAPTSTVFSLGTSGGTNSTSMIAYCFAEVKGFSKFGSYTGNGSTDGTFVYTGFKPAFVLTKVINSVEQWYLWDNKRDTFNFEFKYLLANDSAAENTFYTGGIVDFVSNGFKFRNGTGTYWNGSGSNYIYMAFAENPFVSATLIPTTAR